MLLQIQQRLSHLLHVENLSPLGVTGTFASRKFGLNVYEQARVLALAARIVRRAPGNDIAQLGFRVACTERAELDAFLPAFVESDAPVFTDPVATSTDKLKKFLKSFRFPRKRVVDGSAQHVAVRRLLFISQPMPIIRV